MSPSIKIAGKQTILTYTLESIGGLHAALEQVFGLLRRSGNKYEFLKNKRATNITVEQNPEDRNQIRMEFTLPLRIADMRLSKRPRKGF
jgi:hypothetical protein